MDLKRFFFFSAKKRGKGKAMVSDTKITTLRVKNHRFYRIKMNHKSNCFSSSLFQ